VLLTKTGNIIQGWKKYIEDLLNLPETRSGGVQGWSSITGTEVAILEGVDSISTEFLKVLDVVWLYWLTRLCNITWRTGTVP